MLMLILNLASVQKADIVSRMRYIESVSCIKFQEIQDSDPIPPNYIDIISSTGYVLKYFKVRKNAH